MNLIEVTKQFKTEEACLDYLERVRWPHGLACLRCGVMERISKFTTNETKRKRFSKTKQRVVEVKVPARRLYECLDCGYQFSATTGTVFHDSHLPLVKWFMAVALICEAKKGISAKQVARHLDLEKSYKSAWYLCHRIRKAMREGGLLTGVVEIDQTFLTPRKPRKGNPKVKKEKRETVLGMIERGGKLKLIPIADATLAAIEPELVKHIGPDTLLQSDMSLVHSIIGERLFPGRHRMIDHITSYALGDNHTQHVENAFSLLKRAIYGSYHAVSIKHLARYCEEFSYRFNRRGIQAGLFDSTLRGLLRETALPFKALTAAPEISAS
jgi:transposase-like protein